MNINKAKNINLSQYESLRAGAFFEKILSLLKSPPGYRGSNLQISTLCGAGVLALVLTDA